VTWYFGVAEAKHELQNPISREKILAAGRAVGLGQESRVLDLAGGKGGPATLLAEELGCRVTLVERAPEFASVARGRHEHVEVVEADAAAYPVDPGSFDAALCLGASFVWDGLEGTLGALSRAVGVGGHVVVGEPYWKRWPLPDGYPGKDDPYATLPETVAAIEGAGLDLVALLASSDDDWDRYESLHWQGVEEWAAANPDDPDRDEILGTHRHWRDRYLEWDRDLLGWAIFVGRKRD
jgi:hypothetical protein